MANRRLMVDTSLLIEYFNKTNKQNARLVTQFKNYGQLYISSITEFEVLNGAKQHHIDFWNIMLTRFTVLYFDSAAARQAATITEQLRLRGRNIDKPDLFIAATAVANDLTLDTLNTKHFIPIDRLVIFNSQTNE